MKNLVLFTFIISLALACETQQENIEAYQEAQEIPKPQYSLGQ